MTGDLLVDELSVPIPGRPHRAGSRGRRGAWSGNRRQTAVRARRAGVVGFCGRARAEQHLAADARCNRSRRAAAHGKRGQRPAAACPEFKLSFRLPPSGDAEVAAAAVKKRLEADPPYGVRVRFEIGSSLAGWDAPPVAPWLQASMHAASRATFGQDAMYLGTGGSIPFIGMLGERFPGNAVPGDGRAGPAFECPWPE